LKKLLREQYEKDKRNEESLKPLKDKVIELEKDKAKLERLQAKIKENEELMKRKEELMRMIEGTNDITQIQELVREYCSLPQIKSADEILAEAN